MESLTAEQQRALEAIVAAVPVLLAEAYGEALLAVVLFGSVARGTPHTHSDSDWLVVLRDRSAQPREDHRGCEQVRERLTPCWQRRIPWGCSANPSSICVLPRKRNRGGPCFWISATTG